MGLRKWQLAAVIVAAAVTVAAILAQLVISRRRVRTARQNILSACRESNDTTFVMLVADGTIPAGAVALTLHAIFGAAACPLHVFVGLYQVVQDETDANGGVDAMDAASGTIRPDDAILALYKELAATNDFPFQLVSAHVRVLRIPAAQYKGGFAAREQLLRYLYRGETNVMCLACPAVLTPRWDVKLNTALAQLEARHIRGAVLTTKPALAPRPVLASGLGALQAALANASTKPTYVAVEGRGSPLLCTSASSFAAPRARAYAWKGTSTAPTPALMWSHAFSFSRAHGRRAVLPLPLPRGVSGNEDVMDWVVSFLLFTERRPLLHPHFPVAFALNFANVNVNADTNVKTAAPETDVMLSDPQQIAAMARARARALLLEHFHRRVDDARAFYSAVGVNTTSGWPSARSRLGLTLGAENEEIAAKIGSLSDYMSLLARVDLKKPHRA